VDTSAFPEHGCVVKGRSALCSVPLDVDMEGFRYKASVTMGLRLNPANNTLTESLYVDGAYTIGGGASEGVCVTIEGILFYSRVSCSI
jgi:hypothetical protein